MDWPVEVVTDSGAEAKLAVKELWTEYWQSLNLSPDFGNFAEELRTLPGKYAPPAGCLLLIRIENEAAATAAFRPLGGQACEVKRLYVRPSCRNRGVAASLLATLIEEAKRSGYRDMYCDTLPAMASALALYRSFGFAEVIPYSEHPTPGAIYLHLGLASRYAPDREQSL